MEAGWNFRFVRPFNDWEMEEDQSFLRAVDSKSIRPRLRDRHQWRGAKDGTYSVRTCFEILESGRQQQVPIALTKVGFFAWEAWWGRL